jgi:nicotinate-nucleotide pyrophosphorylase (carboxylating)
MTDFFSLHRDHFDFKTFIKKCIEEDLGSGDHTSLATIPADHDGRMQLLVKEEGVIAGVEAALKVLGYFDRNFKIEVLIPDGTSVKPGDRVFTVEGSTREMLAAERLLLNIMQRMSGIATKTNRLQKLCAGTKAVVIDTRKTTPGFRFFEKWAVLIGGGSNHRYGLFDMVLIKDNHVDFAGGITKAIDAANDYLSRKRLTIPIEIETRSLQDVEAVLSRGGVQRIMLDNFTIRNTLEAVKLIGRKYEVESSGGITENSIEDYARCGVDFISVGALTHNIKSLDLSLKAVKA